MGLTVSSVGRAGGGAVLGTRRGLSARRGFAKHRTGAIAAIVLGAVCLPLAAIATQPLLPTVDSSLPDEELLTFELIEIARQGDPGVGAPINLIDSVRITDAGDIYAIINDFEILRFQRGLAPVLVLRVGDLTPDGRGIFNEFEQLDVAAVSGGTASLAVTALVEEISTGTESLEIWAIGTALERRVARIGEMRFGSTLTGIGSARTNSAGMVAFGATTVSGPMVIRDAGPVSQLVLAPGQSAPGGGTFSGGSAVEISSLTESGDVAIHHPIVAGTTPDAVVGGSPLALNTLLREGDVINVIDSIESLLDPPALGASTAAARAVLTTSGTSLVTSRGPKTIISVGSGATEPLGLPVNDTLTALGLPVGNARGDVAYRATDTSGDGVYLWDAAQSRIFPVAKTLQELFPSGDVIVSIQELTNPILTPQPRVDINASSEIVMRVFVSAEVDAIVLARPVRTSRRLLVDLPGNNDDTTGWGGVVPEFEIDQHEMTNAEYVSFLNREASFSDPHGLYAASMTTLPQGGILRELVGFNWRYRTRPGFAAKPAIELTFENAQRFANWRHAPWYDSGVDPPDLTEGAAYFPGIPRMAQGHWHLPSEDEWYKAAYYEPNAPPVGDYWDYATRSDTLPFDVICDARGDVTNPGVDLANGAASCAWNAVPSMPSTVGSAAAPSPFATFDQAGNLWEFTDTFDLPSTDVIVRGESYLDPITDSATGRFPVPKTTRFLDAGVRSARVRPTPLPFNRTAIPIAAFETHVFYFDLAQLPPRPRLFVDVTNQSGTGITASISMCSGVSRNGGSSFDPTPASTVFPLIQETYLVWAGKARTGLTCTLQLTNLSLSAGTYDLDVFGLSEPITIMSGEPNGYVVSDPNGISGFDDPDTAPGFVTEGANFRWLFDGTLGTCIFNGFGNINYSYVPDPNQGPGWDCCTYQFDGLDELPSEVGQVILQIPPVGLPPDADSDGILDPCDNCVNDANTDQADTDADLIGDACDPVNDTDADGLPDEHTAGPCTGSSSACQDNCKFTINPTQTDTGGPGTSFPDGVGNACACGDVTGDGQALSNDVVEIRKAIAGDPSGLAQASLCNVLGAANTADVDGDGVPDDCGIEDVVVLRRAQLGMAPGVQLACEPAVGP